MRNILFSLQNVSEERNYATPLVTSLVAFTIQLLPLSVICLPPGGI